MLDVHPNCSTAQTATLTAISSQVSSYSQSVTETTSCTGMYVITHVHSYINNTIIATGAVVSSDQLSSSHSSASNDDYTADDDDIDDNTITAIKASAGTYCCTYIIVSTSQFI